MVKTPLFLLSYGQITAESKKFFSYEKHGVLYLPVFSDIQKASAWAKEAIEFTDGRPLMTQVCAKKEDADRLFMFVSVTAGAKVVLDPAPINDMHAIDNIVAE